MGNVTALQHNVRVSFRRCVQKLLLNSFRRVVDAPVVQRRLFVRSADDHLRRCDADAEVERRQDRLCLPELFVKPLSEQEAILFPKLDPAVLVGLQVAQDCLGRGSNLVLNDFSWRRKISGTFFGAAAVYRLSDLSRAAADVVVVVAVVAGGQFRSGEECGGVECGGVGRWGNPSP